VGASLLASPDPMDGRTTLIVAGGGVFVAGAILALILSSRSSTRPPPADLSSDPSATVETEPTTAVAPPTAPSPPPWAPTPPPPPDTPAPGSSTAPPPVTAPHMIGVMPPGLHVQQSPAGPFCKPGVYIDDAGVARKRYCR
jgi:hypothetical protein